MKQPFPQILLGLLVAILVGVVFHAPLTVWLGSSFPDHSLLIKAWKEMLLVLAGLMLLIEATRQKIWQELSRDWLLRISSGFIALHLVFAAFSAQPILAQFAGLLIDLRFVGLFMVIYVAVKLFPEWRRWLVAGSVIAAGLSLLFAFLQVTVLPADVLSHIGYSKDTISAYLTVDQNQAYQRINGTLRGPNPLGLYAVMAFALAATFLASQWRKWKPSYYWVAGLALLALPALWFSYSRSALLAWGVAGAILAIVWGSRHLGKALWLTLAAIVLVTAGGLYVAKDSSFVSHVVMHEDPDEGNDINSNDGHIESLQIGLSRLIRQPFGAGIGSTGSPSLLTDDSHIIENQYLYVAHEVGWIGLAVFIWLSGLVHLGLWRRRHDWLALGLFVSGVGIMIAGLVLPVWVDDTVALVWWGLAAVALGAPLVIQKKGEQS